MFIKPTSKAKNGSIFDVHKAASDFLYYAKGDMIATPWDADVEIKDGEVILTGSIGGSDANTPGAAGYCQCICSIEKFSKWYMLEVPAWVIEENPDIIDAIKEAGWEEAEV